MAISRICMDYSSFHYNKAIEGPHFKCSSKRRFLINFPVDPGRLDQYIPSNARLKVRDGKSWVTACCVKISKMRPWIVPRFLGISFDYVVIRTRAVMEFPDGVEREVVIVLDTNVSRRVAKWMGNLLFGMDFKFNNIEINETDENWTTSLTEQDDVVFKAKIDKKTISDEIQPDSEFDSIDEIEDYFINVSFGSKLKDNELKIFPESREPWDIQTTSVDIIESTLIENLVQTIPEPDHSITVSDDSHYYYWKSDTWSLN